MQSALLTLGGGCNSVARYKYLLSDLQAREELANTIGDLEHFFKI